MAMKKIEARREALQVDEVREASPKSGTG